MDTPWDKPMWQPGDFAWLLSASASLPPFTTFPPPLPPLPPLFGLPEAWTDAGAPRAPAPAPPVLTPLELVIRDRSLGWVTLAYHPAVDLTQPIPLVLDDRRLGPVTIGWIMPGEVEAPRATTIPLTHETGPLPGHESWHQPDDPPVLKADYEGTEGGEGSGDEAAGDEYPTVYAGSDDPARPRAASFPEELVGNLNPISTAQAAGPEEDERGFEELQDPMAAVRIARWNYLTARLREIEPRNRVFESLREPGHIPTEDDLREAEDALNEALRRRDPSAAPTIAQPPGAEPLFIRPPGGSPYDVVVEFRRAEDLRDFMRRRGASEPEIDAAVERFNREQDPSSGNNPPPTGGPPSAGPTIRPGLPLGFPDQNSFREFGADIRTYLARRGYDDVVPMIRGSAVTGIRYDSGLPFDVGENPSDFDLALVSPELLNRAKELGIPLRSRGTRTAPLNDEDLEKLELRDLRDSLSKKSGRKVSFMIYQSVSSVEARGHSLSFGE